MSSRTWLWSCVPKSESSCSTMPNRIMWWMRTFASVVASMLVSAYVLTNLVKWSTNTMTYLFPCFVVVMEPVRSVVSSCPGRVGRIGLSGAR